MIDQIVQLIVEQSQKTEGQNSAARLHAVLMEVGNAVGKIIAAEQKKERAEGKLSPPSGANACHC